VGERTPLPTSRAMGFRLGWRVARPTAEQARVRFETRFRARVEELRQIPEVRAALETIERDVLARWKSGKPFATELPKRGRQTPEPCWYEHWLCRQNGLLVGIEDRGRELPMLHFSLTPRVAQKGLAARVLFPQELLREREYDLWEIKRDASLTDIFEDLRFQYEELRAQRERRGVAFRASGRKGPSSSRRLAALEAYRRRLNGQTWPEVARALGRSSSAIRAAVADLCAAAGLPRPQQGVAPPDLPVADCDNCPRRPSPWRACVDCPVMAHLKKHFPDD
jgi:hypothetical protein